MVGEVKQRYTSSKDLKEVRNKSIRNEREKSNKEERPRAFGTPRKTHMY
jgi:hypothetical protein